MNHGTPILECRRTAHVPTADWDAARAAFAGAQFAPLRQGWRPAPEDAFRPARVATAWNRRDLLIYAELDDEDIFNAVPETDFNRMAIHDGDVFEVFVQPSGQDAYFEMHVSPNNQRLQLRLPSPGALQEACATVSDPAELLKRFEVRGPLFESDVCVRPEKRKWEVLMAVPLARLAGNRPVAVGDRWRFSFSRYDHTRPLGVPVLSSTSPHRVLDFHRIEEWGEWVFG